jgi:hypothetical protein
VEKVFVTPGENEARTQQKLPVGLSNRCNRRNGYRIAIPLLLRHTTFSSPGHALAGFLQQQRRPGRCAGRQARLAAFKDLGTARMDARRTGRRDACTTG